MSVNYILGYSPLPTTSDHLDSCIFSRGSLPYVNDSLYITNQILYLSYANYTVYKFELTSYAKHNEHLQRHICMIRNLEVSYTQTPKLSNIATKKPMKSPTKINKSHFFDHSVQAIIGMGSVIYHFCHLATKIQTTCL